MQASGKETSLQQIHERVQKGARFIPVFSELPLDPHVRPLDIFCEWLKRRPEFKSSAFFLQRSDTEGESHAPKETILAFEPFETIRIRRGQARIENVDGVTHAEGDPFAIVSQRVQEYRAVAYEDLPFFQGGALGYFAYDSVRFLEPSLTALPGNLRSLGAESRGYDAEFSLFRKLMVFDHAHRRLVLFSGFETRRDAPEQGLTRALSEIQELKKQFMSLASLASGASAQAGREEAALPSHEIPQEIPIEEMSAMLGKERFLRGVRKLKDHIRNGDIFQAVLSERMSVPFEGDPLALFRNLLSLSPAPYRFYFGMGESVFLGASPEMLLKVRGRELETHPIAGTRPRGANEAEEHKLESQLMRSEKERAEHLMLVDLARNDIGRVSEPGTVRVSSYMQIKKFSGVMHLVSKVNGELLKSAGSLEALAACFPAGTLSGAPKIRAMQLLSELEPHPRGFYGGAVVAASFTGDLDSCISIRSIQVEGGQAIVQAGAGIVADSQPAKEHEEVSHKSRISRTALFATRTPGRKGARR
jgi:anthranilate synthase component 1